MDITEFHMILDVVRSAVLVVNSYGYFIRLPPRCYYHSIGVLFLGPVIHYNSCICDCSIFWYLVDFIPCHEFDCLCKFCILLSLGKATKFNTYFFHPNIAEKGLVDELVVFCDGPVCYWMYHTICNLFQCRRRVG